MVNTKVYGGQSIKPAVRWASHKRCASLGETYNEMYVDMVVRGIENFSFEIVDVCYSNQFDLDNLEIDLIKNLNSYVYDEGSWGYNMTRGGHGYSVEDSRRRSLKKAKEVIIINDIGKTITSAGIRIFVRENPQYDQAALRKVLLGEVSTHRDIVKVTYTNYNDQISILKTKILNQFNKYSHRNKNFITGKNNPNYNRKHTAETKTAMSIGKDQKNSNRIKYRYYFNDGTIIEYLGMNKFCREYGYTHAGILKMLNGKLKKYRNIIKVEKVI